ncbi:helix-turn-helix domain-containing protein [Halorussus limi]|uniref:Helix-turn-helix domain-containing protein n=1 Tax=Halorussus limi TaxID=2938695 RepID=A0A8U0HS59_9EURY|nr:helix-turn-helix domain-containing protein [Halorussus limi]UPV73820.1 helix-turn-helix domain-containing protein [Halorussus limi]
MTSIADFVLAADGFPLGKAFEDFPDAVFELDRVVPSADTVMPYFWVTDESADMTDVCESLDRLPELRSAVLMEDLGERGLFRAEWEPEFLGIMTAIAETGVTVVSATGSKNGWTFELRAETSDALAAFKQYCDDHDIHVSLAKLSHLSEFETGNAFGLTPEQREALVLAYEEGYYEEPRETDLDALASELGISRQAFSSRLRRGYRIIVESGLTGEGDADT